MQLEKRFVLCNLKNAYHHFKELHPDVKVGFSKFTQLRPKECVLAGTHSVCVCATPKCEVNDCWRHSPRVNSGTTMIFLATILNS